jgi:hypothetical protein
VSNLADIPAAARRRMALLMLAPAGILILAGLVPTLVREGIGWTVVGVLVSLAGLLLMGIALGLRRSVALDEDRAAEAELDAALIAAAPCGGDCSSGACSTEECAVKSLPRQ